MDEKDGGKESRAMETVTIDSNTMKNKQTAHFAA